MRLLILLLAILLLAPGFAPSEPEAIRLARNAYEGGRADDALRRLDSLADTTDDPGLIAYNRGVILASRGEYRAAEIAFTRCLGDEAIPEARRLFAQSNRGICLLRHGSTAKQFRVAIDDFERTIDAKPEDQALLADARHHLELAKLKWIDARSREAKPPTPNDPANDPPRDRPPIEPDRKPEGTGDDSMRGGGPAKSGTTPIPGDARPTDDRTAGQGTLAPLPDHEQIVKRTPDDTKIYLKKAGERLESERRANAELLAGPERKGVRDW